MRGYLASADINLRSEDIEAIDKAGRQAAAGAQRSKYLRTLTPLLFALVLGALMWQLAVKRR